MSVAYHTIAFRYPHRWNRVNPEICCNSRIARYQSVEHDPIAQYVGITNQQYDF